MDFTVRKGTIHGLIGPNGSGKSTLVDLISGRLRPVAGTITIDGVRVEGSGAATRAGLGMTRTFQSAVLVRELTSRQNVTVGVYSRVPNVVPRSPLWPALPSARRDSKRIQTWVNETLSFVGAATGATCTWRTSRTGWNS
ncbi:MAG: ATP-binding cassette domain-containing protein [Gaiellaceae bacterium]